MIPAVTVSRRGATRLQRGHPWIYRSDVRHARFPPGIVTIVEASGRFLGRALFSPESEIRLRLLTDRETEIDAGWWRDQIAAAAGRREGLEIDATAYRIVHAEGDGLPSLIVDRYDDVVVMQILSAGLEAVREDVIAAVDEVLGPRAILLRNDASVRRHEQLPLVVEEVRGPLPERVQIREGALHFDIDLRNGQKTGAFLDQRENHVLMESRACGRALDLFTYQGAFALHLARSAESVIGVDSSAPALAAAKRNAALNRCSNVTWTEANAFDELRRREAAGERFETIVLDPPAFAKRRDAVHRALAGYKEINLRAMRLLTRGGLLLTCSCSFHVHRTQFLDMLAAAAADSGRAIAIERVTGQSADHPELLTVPETGYLKGALVRALDLPAPPTMSPRPSGASPPECPPPRSGCGTPSRRESRRSSRHPPRRCAPPP